MKTDLSVARLRELLHYNPETGIFTWLKSVGRARAGSVAGTIHSKGYIRIKLDGVPYLAHRLAWLYTYNTWPSGHLDHKNRNRSKNDLLNLREATCTQNSHNRTQSKNNSSGQTGVYFITRKNKYQAQITVAGKQIHLGYFDQLDCAVSARRQAEVTYFGEFRRLA